MGSARRSLQHSHCGFTGHHHAGSDHFFYYHATPPLGGRYHCATVGLLIQSSSRCTALSDGAPHHKAGAFRPTRHYHAATQIHPTLDALCRICAAAQCQSGPRRLGRTSPTAVPTIIIIPTTHLHDSIRRGDSLAQCRHRRRLVRPDNQ